MERNVLDIQTYLHEIQKSIQANWQWYFFSGLLLILLGIVGINYAVLTTLFSVIFFGYLLIFGAITLAFHTARFWNKNWRDFFLYLLIAILYGIAGTLILMNPTLGATSLTLALGVFYFFMGVARLIAGIFGQFPGKTLIALNGIICLILAGIVLYYWPASSLWVIGLFVSIDILFVGWWLTLLGWSAKSYQVK